MKNDILGLVQSGIPPEMAAQYQGLTRQQQIADALIKQGMAPGGEAINAGRFLVKRSPLEGIARIAQVFAGDRMAKSADERIGEFGAKLGERNNADLAQYIRERQGGMENSFKGMTRGLDEQDIPQEQAPGNPRQAISNLLMRNPGLASNPMVQFDMQLAQRPPVKTDFGGFIRTTNPDGTSVDENKTPSPTNIVSQENTTARLAQQKELADRIFNNLSASQQAGLQMQAARLGVSVQALMLREAEAKINSANTQYNTGVSVPVPSVTPPLVPGISPSQPQTFSPPQGRQTPAPIGAINNPQERAAYDLVASNLARGVTGSAVPGGQFNPSAQQPTSPVATFAQQTAGERPLAMADTGPQIQSPRARDAAAVSAARGADGVAPVAVVTRDGQGVEFVSRKDAIGRIPANIDAATQARLASAKEGAKVEGKSQATAKIALPQVENFVNRNVSLIDDLKKHAGMPYAVGVFANIPTYYIKGTPGADFKARLDEIKGGMLLSAMEGMRGTGAISNAEGAAGQAARSRMSQAQSPAEFIKAADEYQALLRKDLEIARNKAKTAPPQRPTERGIDSLLDKYAPRR